MPHINTRSSVPLIRNSLFNFRCDVFLIKGDTNFISEKCFLLENQCYIIDQLSNTFKSDYYIRFLKEKSL